MLHPLLINGSFLMERPTGTSTYTLNLLPHLQVLQPILLSARSIAGCAWHPTPIGQTAEQGARGHLARLVWTQFQLPSLWRKLQSSLLFSPIPEAPLWTGQRFVVMAHDLIPLRFPKRFSPLTPYYRYYVPQVLKQAEHIVCNSQATAQDLQQFLRLPATKITPIPLAYDRQHFRPLNLPRQNYFLYLGRRDPYKNLPRLIQAFAALKTDCELWLAGPADPRYTPTLQRQVNELGLENQIKFLDYVSYDQLPILLNQAIALVFPSLWEGFGLPVLEALACGTPVIASNCSSLPEVTGEAALLINPYDVPELTAALRSLLQESDLRQQLGDKGLAQAQQFSWEKTGQATVEVLKRYL